MTPERLPQAATAAGAPLCSDAGEALETRSAGWFAVHARFPLLPDSPAAVRVVVDGRGNGGWTVPVREAGDCVLGLIVSLQGEDRVSLQDAQGAPLDVPFTLIPLTRAQALLRMLSALRRARRAASAVATSVVLLITDGAGVAGAALADLYRDVRRREAADRTSSAVVAPARVRRRWWQLPGTGRGNLIPLQQLVPEGFGPGAGWRATGEDPQFALRAPGGCPLPPGWYRVRARLRTHSGRILAPSLFPDSGRGVSAAEAITLPGPDARGELRAIVLIKAAATGLRFDPTTRHARFSLDEFVIERVPRPVALLGMLRGLQHLRPSSTSSLGVVAEYMREVAACGISAATAGLFAQYSAASSSGAMDYAAWVRRYDTFSSAEHASLLERAGRLTEGPLVSILLPVYETPERWLRQCLDSVLAQAYPRWELCVANDASPSPHVRRVLDDYARRDPRIRVLHRTSNGHIAAASNSALSMARGEFVALLDHDDELRPHALLEVAELIAAAPDVGFVYSDEDKIDAKGRRFQPYFKPDWNPDLLLSQNYLCHFSVLRADQVRDAGGFREGYEGSQDHDLFLRCTRRLRPEQIRHIPKVLYHWRAIEGSTALHRGAKDYAGDAGARAVADHLAQTTAGAVVEQLPHGHYRVRWPLPDPAPRVAIVVPTRDRLELLRPCIESLCSITRYPNFEVVVVDNQSAESDTLAYLDELRSRACIRVLRYDRPFNYSALNNWAVAHCDAELIALLNNDIEIVDPDWLSEMASHAVRPDIGAVGAMLHYPDGSIQHAGVILGLGGVANHAYMGQPRGYPGHGGRAKVAQNLSAVTAACLLVRRSSYLEVGGLDEDLAVAFNDIDFCLRLRALGLRNLWTPFAELVHHESASRGRDDSEEKRARFHAEVALMEARWGDLLRADPAYNPNLTLASVNSEMASPPRSVSH